MDQRAQIATAFRERAIQLRLVGEIMRNELARQLILKTAGDYESIAAAIEAPEGPQTLLELLKSVAREDF